MPATYKLNLLSPCLSFDGDDHVQVGDVLDQTGSFTLEAWVKVTSLAAQRAVVTKHDGTTGWGLEILTTGAVRFTISTQTDADTDTAGGLITTGIWHHLAAVYDAAANQRRIYIDGVERASENVTGAPAGNAHNLRFGRRHGDGNPMVGLIDDCRIWSGTARTGAQIADFRLRRLAGTETGLGGLWRMDEDTGTQVKDATANANHGTITGATWSEREIADVAADLREYSISRGRSEAIRGEIVTGQARIQLNNVEGKTSSPALSFDGVDDKVALPSMTATQTITVEAWIKTSLAGQRVAWSNRAGSGAFYFGYSSNRIFYFDSGGTPASTDGGPALNDGVWHHIAVVRTATNVTLYLDGIQVAQVIFSVAPPASTGTAHIGHDPANGEFWNGLIDEVRIWNGARTQAQIQNNMRRRLAGNEQGLVGYWRLDEASGTQAQDATANGNHGTITGATWSTRDQPYFIEGTYSPDNPASKYAGLLRPFLKARITATSGAVTKDRFTGYILNYEPETRLGAGPEDERVVNCVLEDRFKLLRARRVTTGILADQTLGAIVTELLDKVGVPSGERILATTVDASPFALFTDEDALEALRKVVEAGQYAHYIDPAGKYRLENRYWTLGAATYRTYSSEMVDFQPAYDEGSILNSVQVKSQPRKKDANLAVVAKLQVPYELAAGASVEIWLEHIDPTLSTAERAPADEMVVPVATTDYTAGSTSTGTDKTAQLGVVVTFFAEKTKVKFTNNDANTIFITKFDPRGKPLRKQTPILREAIDATSKEDFQGHEEVIDNDLIGSDLYAKDMADFLVLDRKDVMPRAEMTLRDLFPDVLEIDLGTVIEIAESLTGVTGRWVVDGLTETVREQGFEHTVTYRLLKYTDYAWKIFDKDPEGRLDQRRLAF